MSARAYESDFFEWCHAQASILRSNDMSQLDRDNLADEIESMAGRERRELRNRLKRLTQHLLKWRFQPELRCASWKSTLLVQREEIGNLLADSPSLRRQLVEILPQAYERGRFEALKETGLFSLPEHCPFAVDDILRDDFYPD